MKTVEISVKTTETHHEVRVNGQLASRFKKTLEGFNESVVYAIQRALSSRFDFGNKDVILTLPGDGVGPASLVKDINFSLKVMELK